MKEETELINVNRNWDVFSGVPTLDLHQSGPFDSAGLWSWWRSQTHPPSSLRSSCPTWHRSRWRCLFGPLPHWQDTCFKLCVAWTQRCKNKKALIHLPTVDHNGPGILGVAGLDFLEELKHANRGEGHPKVWPAGKVKLGDKPLRLLARHISHLRQKQAKAKKISGSIYVISYKIWISFMSMVKLL